jgi:hypothetical protein
MPKKILFSGHWKGEFIYGPEYGELYGERVSFMLFLEGNGDEFTGKCFDIDGIGALPDVASINGFYDSGVISFIKQYPHRYEMEEDGKLNLVEDKAAPEVQYFGEFNENRDKFMGKWEIVIHEEKEGEGFLEYLCTGTWEMKKEVE